MALDLGRQAQAYRPTASSQMLRSQPAARCAPDTSGVRRGQHPGPRLSVPRELLSPCFVGLPVVWICHIRWQRYAVPPQRQRLRQAAVKTQGFEVGPRSAKGGGHGDHPLTRSISDEEYGRVQDDRFRSLVMKAYLELEKYEAVDAAVMSTLLEEMTRMTSAISWQRQLYMILAQWRELCKQRGILNIEDGIAPELLEEKAPEPLCWRQVANVGGLTVAAAEIVFWKGTADSKDVRGRASRGFAAQSDDDFESSEDLRSCGQRDHELVGMTIQCLVEALSKLMDDNSGPIRLLIPEDTSKAVVQKVVEAVGRLGDELQVQTYSGSPTWDQLVSESHSMVLLYRDAAVPASSECWTLPGEATCGRRAVNAAPVLMLSILQHGVRMNMPGTYKKMVEWVMQASQTEMDLEEEPQDLFSQLSQAFVSSLREDAPNIFDLRSKISAATRFLRSKLFLVIRKAYGNAWTKLSTPRLQQLKVGEKEAKLLLRRRRERNAAAAILEADLSQAVQNLNLQRFEEKSRFAQQEQMLPEGKLKSLRDQMSLVIVAAQAPIKRLTDTCCRSIDGALNPEVLQALQAELASTRLTTSDIWLQAGLELKLALEALQQLQIHTNEFLSGHGSTASMPSQMPGEGTGQRSRAVATLAKDVAEAKECLGRFERRLSATGREVSPEGIQPLRQFVSKCDARLVDARHDDELYQILQAPPWGHKKRLFAGITEAAWQKLQAAADQATDSARSRLQEQLQEAHSLMQLADQLREAIKGDNETVLETLLREAEKLDISGLHTAQSRCEQLRSMRSDLQRSLTAAVAELDVAAFETLEARCGQLPAEEVEQFRQDLVLSIAEEEKQLQEVINSSDPSEESLGAALTKCRLSSQNSWRRLAESSLTALQAINRIRSTLACVPVDEMGLQARLSSGSFAAKELQKLSAEAQKLSEGAQIKATLFSTLQTALDEGYVGLAGAQADQALETLLSAKIWKDGHWKSIQPSDLRELEIRAEEATKAGRDRLAEPLQTALEVGQCSVELAAAMRENDAEKLEACLEKARQLGFNRLEEVQRRLQNMRFSMEGRRGLRRPVRNAESPALLLPSAPAEQNPPFEEENARKTWPSPAEKSEHNGQDKQDQLMRYEAHDQQVRCTNLIFIDLETTSGFYDFEEMPQILEVAIIITDRHLNELDRGHWVVGGFSRKELESLGEFHKANFRDSEPGGNFPPLMGYGGGNGLFSDILASVLSTEQVENQIMQIVVQHCPPGECPLVGYSVQCDREVIKDKMPRLYRHLSHQIVDVSSFFIVSRLWLPEHWQYWDRRSETYNHRAVNDVEDAIEALRWVREKFFSESLLPFGAAKETLPTAASLL
eukprot:s2513_g6.t1